MIWETVTLAQRWNEHPAGTPLHIPEHVADALRDGGFVAPVDVEEMTVKELKTALRAKGLSVTGNKSELLARLHEPED